MKHKICTECKQLKDLNSFSPGNAKFDRHSRCKECNAKIAKEYRKTKRGKEYQKQYWKSDRGKRVLSRYKTSEKGKQAGRKYTQSKNGKEKLRQYTQSKRREDKARFQARAAVNNAVRSGKLPKVSTQKCISCYKNAQDYHHHKGHNKENWLDVIPMCRKCHRNYEKHL